MPYLSQLEFFLFPCCFRQGWVHVTLRNKNNIGLIWFVFISSSDFWLLCHLMAKKEKLSQNAQNNLKLCQKWRRHTEDPWLEYIESIFVDFKKVSDRFCLRGFGQRFNYSYDPNIWYFFAQYLPFLLSTFFLGLPVLCNRQSFLHLFFYAPLFLFSLTLHCCISWLPGWKEPDLSAHSPD